MAQERGFACTGPAGELYVGAHADGCTVFVGKSAYCRRTGNTAFVGNTESRWPRL